MDGRTWKAVEETKVMWGRREQGLGRYIRDIWVDAAVEPLKLQHWAESSESQR